MQLRGEESEQSGKVPLHRNMEISLRNMGMPKKNLKKTPSYNLHPDYSQPSSNQQQPTTAEHINYTPN